MENNKKENKWSGVKKYEERKTAIAQNKTWVSEDERRRKTTQANERSLKMFEGNGKGKGRKWNEK